jgi:VIT1/CCC1 family predicted Fe2+/Mn2+ transporter
MGFIGAAIPILSYSVLHAEGIYSLTFSYFALGMLGIFLGKSSGGRMSNWFLSLVILGVIMTVVGYFLKIVS